MNIAALRAFVNDNQRRGGHSDDRRMIDGTEYSIPHRDYAWFTPSSGKHGTMFAASFYIAHEGVGRLVNALLVAEVFPLTKSGRSRKNPKRQAR